VNPDQVVSAGEEPREGLIANGINLRIRAVLDKIEDYEHEKNIGDWDLKIYSQEAMTYFALLLRGEYAKYIGT
jgi:hypothetical protein